MQKLGKGETVSVTFRVEKEKWGEFIKWCERNKVAAAEILRMYIAQELKGSKT